MVRGGVRARVALAEQPGQRLPARDVGTVQEAQQRMEPERALPGCCSVLLLAVRDCDGGIEVQTQFGAQVRASTRGPRLGSCRRATCPNRGEVDRVDTIQHPPRGRHRGHRPMQILTLSQHRDPADRVRTISDRDRQISEHTPRRMEPRTPIGVGQRGGDRVDQAGVLSHLAEQTDPGMRHHAGPVRTDHDPTIPLATLHLTSARPLGDFEPSQVQVSQAVRALSRSRATCRPDQRETPRLMPSSNRRIDQSTSPVAPAAAVSLFSTTSHAPSAAIRRCHVHTASATG